MIIKTDANATTEGVNLRSRFRVRTPAIMINGITMPTAWT